MPGGRKRWLIAIAAAGGLAICAWAYFSDGTISERAHLAARWTVRWSVWWFTAAFAARPLHQAFGGVFTGWLRQRRYIGLGFAAAHGIHAIAFSTLFFATGELPRAATLVGGTIAYPFILAMALTSNDAAQRRMGRNWKRLHTTGMWVLWVIFAVGYVRGTFKPDAWPLAPVLAVLLVGTALLRVPAIRRLVATRRAAA